MQWIPVALLALVGGATGHTDTFRVRNTNDSGTNSLRWAISQANTHIGRDKIVFAASMNGKVILPSSALPEITDHRTIIKGDINADGKPDVAINGKNAATAYGLFLRGARRCTIEGLAVCNFALNGIEIRESNYCTVRSCHVGVNLAGTNAVSNGYNNVFVVRSDCCTIGGTTDAERNIIAGSAGLLRAGIYVTDSAYATVTGNYIGLTRNGQAVLGTGGTGVHMDTIKFPSDYATIGGTTPGTRNVLGGLDVGLEMDNASHCSIVGNYFGLMADGDTGAGIGTYCIRMTGGNHDNLIGGTATGAGNVFAGGAQAGIHISSSGAEPNKIRGNYFGLNAAGTQQRRLQQGIELEMDAGAQIIGGGTAQGGNYFTPKAPSGTTVGIYFKYGGGTGSLVQRNVFGVRPSGQDAVGVVKGLEVEETIVTILDNVFARCSGSGVMADDLGANPKVFRNTFRHCGYGVSINDGARCRLGNLGNASTTDDGGNVFRPSNTYHIHNNTANRITAEGNDFRTTSRAEIDAKIYDRRDNPTRGRVDFNPLIGGVLPTGAALYLTGVAALPTAGGAQIAFSLSTPAQVEARILNIAGRSVKTLCRSRDCESGPNALLWNAQSDEGLPVPNGTYLVEVTAKADDGAQARRLAQVRLNR